MRPTIFNYLFTLMVLSGFLTYSQKTDSEQTLRHTSTIATFDLRSKELVGSRYIEEKFLPAKISDNNGIYLIKYNAYNDEMEGEKDNRAYHLIKNMDYTVVFEGTNKIYKVFNYIEKDEVIPGFFVVLYMGKKNSLLLKEKIKLYDEEKPKTGYDKYKPPTLKRIKDKLYIGFNNNLTKEFPNKKKDILALFSGKENEIEVYAKKNKLSFNKTEDLIKILNYYNSLK